MKLNITIEPQSLNGYVNISPLLGKSLFQLDVENNSCTDIIAEVIDYIPHTLLQQVVDHYLSKLRHKARIILGGTSLLELSRLVMIGQINQADANKIIFGTNNHAWDMKRSLSDLHIVAKYLQEKGLKLIKQRLDGVKWCVEAIRE